MRASWLLLDQGGEAPKKVAAVTTKLGELNTAALGSKNALDQFIESQKKAIAGHEAEAQSIGAGVGVKEQLKVQYEAEQIALSNNIKLTDAYRQKITDLGTAAANAAITLAGAQMKQDALTPWGSSTGKNWPT